MSIHYADQMLETFVLESPNIIMVALCNAFSCRMSETLPSTRVQRRDTIMQTARDASQRAEMFIRQACDELGQCTKAGYHRRAYNPDRAGLPANDVPALTQSIVHALQQRSCEEALDYFAMLMGGWCLCCPAPLAQPYLVDGQDLTDGGIAQSLLAWTFRPLDFCD
jgi:hypothetical protein